MTLPPALPNKTETGKPAGGWKKKPARKEAPKPKAAPRSAPIPDPSGVVKTLPSGAQYKIYTIPLSLLPAFLESKGLEPKKFYYFIPESKEVLGVRPIGYEEEKEEE